MRPFLLTMALATTLAAPAQQPATHPAEGSNWQHVQALPPGAQLHIKTSSGSVSCRFRSADADSLTCTSGKEMKLTQQEIRTIRVSHRGRSSLVGLGVGAAGGAIALQATDKPGSWFHGEVVTAGAVLFGGVGAAVGALTDFTRSTVYRAP